MQFCSVCGSSDLIQLQHGGCGGFGQKLACKNCKSVFVQQSGGICPTPGGEQWQRAHYQASEKEIKAAEERWEKRFPKPNSEKQ